MKICLSNGQTTSYLERAQEISFNYKDREKIIDTYEKYPNADMILVHFANIEPILDWEEITNISNITKGHFILGTNSLVECKEAKSHNIKFFYNKRINNFLEVNALKALGSCYVIPGEPIFFQMDFLKARGIPIRVIPNLVFLEPGLHKNGVLGTWIRPEDMFMYKKYISAIEFYTANSESPLAKERGLFRVYVKNEEWMEELSLLITGLNCPGNNGLIDSDYTSARLNCAQACQYKSSCRICYDIFEIADLSTLQSYMELLDKKEEN